MLLAPLKLLWLASILVISCDSATPQASHTAIKQTASTPQSAVSSARKTKPNASTPKTKQPSIAREIDANRVFDFLVSEERRKQLTPEKVKKQLSWLVDDLEEESNEISRIFRKVNTTGFIRNVEITFGKEGKGEVVIDSIRIAMHPSDTKSISKRLYEHAQKTFNKPVWSTPESTGFRLSAEWELVIEDSGEGVITLAAYRPTED